MSDLESFNFPNFIFRKLWSVKKNIDICSFEQSLSDRTNTWQNPLPCSNPVCSHQTMQLIHCN